MKEVDTARSAWRRGLQPARLREVAAWLAASEQFWAAKLSDLGAYLDATHDG